MTRTEILEELKKLTPAERLAVVEAAIRLIREDLRRATQPSTKAERAKQLAKAAEVLLPDYTADSELTAFTA